MHPLEQHLIVRHRLAELRAEAATHRLARDAGTPGFRARVGHALIGIGGLLAGEVIERRQRQPGRRKADPCEPAAA